MRIRRAFRFWPGLAALAAVVLALLAHGVFAAADDARSGRSPGALASTGEALVGTRDDRVFRRTLALVAAATQPGLSPGAAFKRRAVAEAALAQATQDGPARIRAQAAHLLAALALRDAAVDRDNAQRYIADAISGFTTAIRLDPHDNASKFDLELLLSVGGNQERRRGPGRQSRGAAGAAPGRSGSGY
jgi:hypothetical protein